MTDHSEVLIKHMVDRFLAWKLPENFRPDAGISFEPEYNEEWNAKQGLPPSRHEPRGTNLFDATQARAMVLHMLEELSSGTRLEEAAKNLIASRSSTFRAGNNRQVGIQDEHGEKMWIVPFDEMAALETSLLFLAPDPPTEPTRAEDAPHVDGAKVFLTDENSGVLFAPGEKFHGWLMRRHPDGYWVSVRKLDAADPADNPLARMLLGAGK